MRFSRALLASVFGFAAFSYGMEMESDMEMSSSEMMGSGSVSENVGSSGTSPIDYSTVVPIPHEGMEHGMPILKTKLTPAERLYWESYNTTTFFSSDKGNRGAFWYHVFTISAATVFVYPVCLALNNIDSGWYIPLLAIFNFLVISSLVSLSIFDESFPEAMYPKNAYRRMSYILFVITLVHFASALIVRTARWLSGGGSDAEVSFELNNYTGNADFIALNGYGESNSNETSNSIGDERNESHYKNSRNSVGSPTTTLFDPQSRHQDDLRASNYRDDSNSFEIGDEEFTKDLEQTVLDNDGFQIRHQSKSSVKRDTFLAKIYKYKLLQNAANKFSTFFTILFHMTNYPLLIFLFVYIPVGIAVGTLFGLGSRVFNLLAHWIKGGVFFSLGLVSLARYCGFGATRGWAWNKTITFKNQVGNTNSFWFRWMPRGGITMEAIESFLIFFYGTTNVFLEHLANPGGAWAAKDLQHVSIAFMFIGCGLCGLLAEIKLSDWRFNHVLKHTNIQSEAIHSGNPGYSPNPFPAFTIFWTGILMSQHAQASATSTTVHVQWGNLLSYGSFFRIFTFILLMLVPNKNLNPSRPFTELITAFCLLCGGLVFMESTDQVIEAMEYRGFTPMFTFNLSVGFITLLMAWEMVLFMWKDWLKERKNRM